MERQPLVASHTATRGWTAFQPAGRFSGDSAPNPGLPSQPRAINRDIQRSSKIRSATPVPAAKPNLPVSKVTRGGAQTRRHCRIMVVTTDMSRTVSSATGMLAPFFNVVKGPCAEKRDNLVTLNPAVDHSTFFKASSATLLLMHRRSPRLPRLVTTCVSGSLTVTESVTHGTAR